MSLALTLPCPEAICPTPVTVSIPRPSLRRSRPWSPSEYLIDVDFAAPDGHQSFAVGGGRTLEDALASAREALPPGLEWDVVRWNHVHGD